MKFLIAIALLFCSFTVAANGNHNQNGHEHEGGSTTTTTTTTTNNTTNNYYTQEGSTETIVRSSSSGLGEDVDKAIAMSISGDQCVYDYAKGWQGCVAVGYFSDYAALNLSAATRVDELMVRFGVQTTEEVDDFAVGVGVSWHF